MNLVLPVIKKQFRGFRRVLLLSFFAIVAAMAVIPIVTYLYFVSDLTSTEAIMNKKSAGVVLLDKNGEPFFTFYDAKLRSEIPLAQIPKHTQDAFISIEDRAFYKHPGFSIKAITRSAIDNLQSKDLSYGGSTITQQLVKNSLLTPKKEFMRKLQEIVLAQEIERRYSKEQILEMYLNSVYLGEGSFGVEEAAQNYFGKGAKDLNISESAFLAGILPAPSRLSRDLEKAKLRQEIVLQKMVEEGYLEEKDRDIAKKEEVALKEKVEGINAFAPHFALMVKDALVEKYGEETVTRSGFVVKTTLDLEWQKYAEKVVAEQVKKLEKNRATNASAVAIDPKNGEIRVLVGSKDWYDEKFGKVNIALSQRPPGSAFKPIVYLAAMERGIINPATTLKDTPTAFKNDQQLILLGAERAITDTKVVRATNTNDPNYYYKPQNYDRKFRGPVTVRRALSNSLNVPAVEVMAKVGLMDGLSMAKKLGVNTLKEPTDYGLSLVLGTGEVKLLELTSAYSVLANNGYKNNPTSILEIQDKMGKLLYKHQPTPDKVIDEKYAFLISSILSDNKARTEMFGNSLTISRTAAVKTGTTEDYKDAWTVGYTPSLTIGVWVGNNFGEPMDRVAGSLGAAPIWKSLMEKFLEGSPKENFEVPEGVISTSVCRSITVVGTDSKTATISAGMEFFIKGTEPKTPCRINKPQSTPAGSANPQPSPSSTPTPESKKDEDKEKEKNNIKESNAWILIYT